MKECKTEGCTNKTQARSEFNSKGQMRYKTYCGPCLKAKAGNYPVYHIFKKSECEMCGFIPKHSCQLDVDHVNGDRKDNSTSNLQTLCANCHRLKTHLNGEYKGT